MCYANIFSEQMPFNQELEPLQLKHVCAFQTERQKVILHLCFLATLLERTCTFLFKSCNVNQPKLKNFPLNNALHLFL